jgi:hypothetical protein
LNEEHTSLLKRPLKAKTPIRRSAVTGKKRVIAQEQLYTNAAFCTGKRRVRAKPVLNCPRLAAPYFTLIKVPLLGPRENGRRWRKKTIQSIELGRISNMELRGLVVRAAAELPHSKWVADNVGWFGLESAHRNLWVGRYVVLW